MKIHQYKAHQCLHVTCIIWNCSQKKPKNKDKQINFPAVCLATITTALYNTRHQITNISKTSKFTASYDNVMSKLNLNNQPLKHEKKTPNSCDIITTARTNHLLLAIIKRGSYKSKHTGLFYTAGTLSNFHVCNCLDDKTKHCQ